MGRRGSGFVYGPKVRTPTYQPTAAPHGESRKERVKRAYFKQGKQAAIALGIRLGVKANSVRSWIWEWEKPNRPRRPPRPSSDQPADRIGEALFADFGGIDEETWSWMVDSFERFEDIERDDGKAVARDDALALIAASVIYLTRTCGSRRTFEAMQRLTDQLVDDAGVLTPLGE